MSMCTTSWSPAGTVVIRGADRAHGFLQRLIDDRNSRCADNIIHSAAQLPARSPRPSVTKAARVCTASDSGLQLAEVQLGGV